MVLLGGVEEIAQPSAFSPQPPLSELLKMLRRSVLPCGIAGSTTQLLRRPGLLYIPSWGWSNQCPARSSSASELLRGDFWLLSALLGQQVSLCGKHGAVKIWGLGTPRDVV